MIDQATVDKIITMARIEDVVGDFVTLRRRGVNLIGLCPFHNEKTPSFTVSPAKNICKCFGCGKGGSPINFIMELEHLSFTDALRYLAKRYNIEIVEKDLTPEQINARNDRESMFALNEFAQKYFTKTLFENESGVAIGMSYFKERGFTNETIEKFKLGYSLDSYDAFATHAINSGYNRKFLVSTGLCKETEKNTLIDRFRGRIIFPVHTISGKVVAFGGRILVTNDKSAKYLNSPESEIYHKSDHLYGIFQAKESIVKKDNCFLVEGYTDVMSMHQSGIHNVIASSGTALTKGQINLIHRFTSNITVLYDGDAAGLKASIRGIDLLLEEGMNIKVVQLPEGEDPDSFAQKHNADQLIEYLNENQIDFIQFKTNLLLDEAGNDPIKRAKLISDIANSIAIIPDNIIRSVYIQECARRFEMNEAVITKEITKIRNKALYANKPNNALAGFNSQSAASSTQYVARYNDPPVANNDAPSVNDFDLKREFTFSQESNIIRLLIKYGKTIIITDQDQKYNLAQYIDFNLKDDEMNMQIPLNNKLLSDSLIVQTDDLRTYFLNYPDIEIQNYVFSLLEDKYELSRNKNPNKKEPDSDEFIKELIEKANRYLYEFKFRILQKWCNQLVIEIKDAQAKGDSDRLTSLLERQIEYKLMQKALTNCLGARSIYSKKN